LFAHERLLTHVFAMDIAALRREYVLGGLHRRDLAVDPIDQFNAWFAQACAAEIPEPNAMTLSTVSPDGQPSSRIVLLKAVDGRGFSFYTNYLGRKSQELGKNPAAALTFFWSGLERQVCVRGLCAKNSREESEVYFKSRPLGSQLGAWASRQDEIVPDREYLEGRLAEVTTRYGDNVPLPSYWGGYILSPKSVEFWQGRPNRLHDRFLYTREENRWRIDRLSP
jgi:pyridoxamine 5'-phosphate oxidase